MDIYYRNKIDELFKKDIQSHESLKDKTKAKKEEQLELFSHLKRNLEPKNNMIYKVNINTRKSMNMLKIPTNEVLDMKVSHSNINDQINNCINISSSKNNSKFLLKRNSLRFCNTVGESDDKNEKNENNKKNETNGKGSQSKNTNMMKFVEQNENNEFESSNISFYDRFLKNLKEDPGIENGKIKGKEIEKPSTDHTNKNKSNSNINNIINNINNPKSNSNNRNKYLVKSKNSVGNVCNYNLHSSCNLKKNKKQKNYNKVKKPSITNNKDKIKNNNNDNSNNNSNNKHHNKKIQHLSQIPLQKVNENKINNSIENNNKLTKRRGSVYKQKKNRKDCDENNDVSLTPVLKSNTIKKKNFVKYYSYDDEDGDNNNNNNEDNNNENNESENKSNNSENEKIENDKIENEKIENEKIENDKNNKEKNSYHDFTSVEDNYKYPHKRKHFNTQEILNDKSIKGMKYSSDLTSKKAKLKKRKFKYMSIEQFMGIRKQRFEIVEPENLISLEFNGVNKNKETNNQVVIYSNNENFVNFDEKNDTNDNVNCSENKKKKKRKIFCCI